MTGNGPVVCVVAPREAEYSETFVRAHVERLLARTLALYGPKLRHPNDFARPVRSTLKGVVDGRMRRFLGTPHTAFPDTGLRRFLRAERVAAVLAEFGPTGEAIHNDCAAVQVPLVVHFHGNDAFARRWVESFGPLTSTCSLARRASWQCLTRWRSNSLSSVRRETRFTTTRAAPTSRGSRWADLKTRRRTFWPSEGSSRRKVRTGHWPRSGGC